MMNPTFTTNTRVDTGGWGRNPRLTVAVAEGELVLSAPGKRPFLERLSFAGLRGSRYNHVTGELILAPAPAARVSQLRLPPLEAAAVLTAIHGKENKSC